MMFGLIAALLLQQARPQASAASSPTGVPTSPIPSQSASVSPNAEPAVMPPIPADAAVIRNSGSTNTIGYTIVLSPDGSAVILQNGRRVNASVATPQTNWLFAKLREAAPLDALPVGRCMRSASFGSLTTITYGGATTPDLGCAVSPLERELARTVGVIVAQLHISVFPVNRRQLL